MSKKVINKYREVLRKAKQELKDAIRGRDYQDYLYSQDNYDTIQDVDNLVERRKMFNTKIYLLQDLFKGDLDD